MTVDVDALARELLADTPPLVGWEQGGETVRMWAWRRIALAYDEAHRLAPYITRLLAEHVEDETHNPWKAVVVGEACNTFTYDPADTPLEMLRKAIQWNQDVALDPKASEEAVRLTAEAREQGRREGLEEAAGVADAWKSPLRPGSTDRLLGQQEASRSIAALIRATEGQTDE